MKVNRSKSLTALAALSCLLGRPVNADTTLSVGNTSGFPGSTVSIPVILQNSAGVVAAQFDLVYPASDLAAGAATAGGALAGHVVRSSKPALSSRRVVIYSL